MLRQFFRSGGWIALIALLIAALALAGWYGAGADARALDARGITTQARVTDLAQENRYSASSPDKRTPAWVVEVTFTTGKAADNSIAVHSLRRDVSEPFWSGLTKGQEIPIRYLPEDPDLAEVEPGAVAGNATAALWVAIGFLALGLPLTLVFARNAARAARIARSGLPRKGRVTALEKHESIHVLLFTWTGADGAEHQGRSRPSARANRFKDHPQGSQIDLLEDPANPAKAWWLRDVT